jgi:hypothetical protein
MAHKIPSNRTRLTAKEQAFVEHYKGNALDACRKAGYKQPASMSWQVMRLPRIIKALEEKHKTFIAAVAQREAQAVKITRNDIINGLAKLAQKSKSENARVSAYAQLKDIFGLSARNSNTDIFAGWTDEELDHYRTTGRLPPSRDGSSLGFGGSAPGDAEAPEV